MLFAILPQLRVLPHFCRFHDTYARSFVDIYKICIKIFVTDRITAFPDYTEQRVMERICFDTQR